MGADKRLLVLLARFIVPPFHLKHWKWYRFSVFFIADAIFITLAYWGAFWLRLEDPTLGAYRNTFFSTLPWVYLANGITFGVGGLYRQVWRFANFHSAVRILSCVFWGTVLAGLFIFIASLGGSKLPPRSIAIIYFLLAALLIGIEKFSWRAWTQVQRNLKQDKKIRCVIYGAGSAGELFVRHTIENLMSDYKPVCFLDDDPNKKGRIVHGLKIRGGRGKIQEICKQFGIDTVILAMPSASGKDVREIIGICQKVRIHTLVMPDITNSLGIDVIRPRSVDVADLLKRSPKKTDTDKITSFLKDRTILISGAGGSIGSEICRQVLSCRPNHMILLDNSEHNLYQIELELRKLRGFTQTNLTPILASVNDRPVIERLMREHRPFGVLHAAAYKHVPIVESNPLAGIINNIEGTKIIAEESIKAGVNTFVLISTDKAVNPTNVMGATKRSCEKLILSLNLLSRHTTKFSAVRFGNVLGSSGSVIPRFLKQIQEGGPVTVTHPDITRYFMLTSEAVGLVLQSDIPNN